MKDFSVKKIILCALTVVFAVFILSCPAFNLIQSGKEGLCGFDLFGQDGLFDDEALYLTVKIISYLMTIYGAIAVVLSIFAFFLFSLKRSKALGNANAIIGLVLTFVYLVCGGVLANEMGTKTVSFVPFLIIALASIAFWICNALLVFPSKGTPIRRSRSLDEAERVELLRKYKLLLDDGILSQEEFEKKKKELLGL